MTATPEQDHPDRLAEIKQRVARDVQLGRVVSACPVPWIEAALVDRDWLIAEVERLRSALAHHVDTQITPATGNTWDRGGE